MCAAYRFDGISSGSPDYWTAFVRAHMSRLQAHGYNKYQITSRIVCYVSDTVPT
jgi:hypothetical protein